MILRITKDEAIRAVLAFLDIECGNPRASENPTFWSKKDTQPVDIQVIFDFEED